MYLLYRILLISFCLAITACSENDNKIHIIPSQTSNKYLLNLEKVILSDERNDSSDYESSLIFKKIKSWQKNSFIAVGDSNYLKIIIKQAEVKKTSLEKNDNFFIDQQDYLYTASVSANLEIYNDHDIFPLLSSTINVSLDKSLAESSNFHDRQNLVHILISELINNLDREVKNLMENNFNEFIANDEQDISQSNFQAALSDLGYKTQKSKDAFLELLQIFKIFDDEYFIEDINSFNNSSIKEANYNCLIQDSKIKLRTRNNNDSQINFCTKSDIINWLDYATNKHFRKNTERWEILDHEVINDNRNDLLKILDSIGYIHEIFPKKTFYDHILVLGALEKTVAKRLNFLEYMWKKNIRFNSIYLLGADRKLDSKLEPIAEYIMSKYGANSATEMKMMELTYDKFKSNWPSELQNIKVISVNTLLQIKEDGSKRRPDTLETIVSYKKYLAAKESILVISDQPHINYQDSVVRKVINDQDHYIETIGNKWDEKEDSISVSLDSIARDIHMKTKIIYSYN